MMSDNMEQDESAFILMSNQFPVPSTLLSLTAARDNGLRLLVTHRQKLQSLAVLAVCTQSSPQAITC